MLQVRFMLDVAYVNTNLFIRINSIWALYKLNLKRLHFKITFISDNLFLSRSVFNHDQLYVDKSGVSSISGINIWINKYSLSKSNL